MEITFDHHAKYYINCKHHPDIPLSFILNITKSNDAITSIHHFCQYFTNKLELFSHLCRESVFWLMMCLM